MRILLAEDERMLSKALVAILKRNNYAVDAVYDGQEAIDQLMAMDYDGVILDIMMPKKDGVTVLQEFRQYNKKTPVLMLTAKAEISNRVGALDDGADDYLPKPFDTQELLARIRAMLRRNGGEADNLLKLGNLTLNRATFELSTPKGSCRLSNKEFQMMTMLLVNAGKVIASDKFMDQIWGMEENVDVTVVWTYLSYLRKKLANLEAYCQIKAIRNLGYVLEVHND